MQIEAHNSGPVSGSSSRMPLGHGVRQEGLHSAAAKRCPKLKAYV
jgi:hypothetical protein